MHERIRHVAAWFLASIVFLSIWAAPASAQDGHECTTRACEHNGGADAGPDGVSAFISGDGSSGIRAHGGESCTYWRLPISGVVETISGAETGPYQLDDGTVFIWIAWQCNADGNDCRTVGANDGSGVDFGDPKRIYLDCDGDGIADGQIGNVVTEIGNTDDLALAALDGMPWPEMEIVTVPEQEGDVISGFPIGLRLDGPATFETIVEAEAEENGLVVTAFATAELVTWEGGTINSDRGGEDLVECESFGEAFYDANPCTITWKSSSAGQPGDRITLVSVVRYAVEYETNVVGIVATGPEEYELLFERADFPVAEVHALITK